MTSDAPPTQDVIPGEQPGIQLTRGVNYLIAIAIDEYVHLHQLYNCVKDVTDLINVLTQNYAFESDNVKELYNNLATYENIVVALDDLAKRLNEKDSLLVLYSGHGEVRNEIGYWIPVNAEKFTDYLLVSTVKQYLEPIKARHIFVIADACFAGSFFEPTRSSIDWTAYVERKPSRYALTAGRDEPVLDGRPGENSPFADALKFRLSTSTGPIGAVKLSEQVLQDVIQRSEGFQTPRHGELVIRGNEHGQFFFHKKQSDDVEGDPFIDIYFKKGGNLFPPGDRRSVQEYFDKYDQDFNAKPDEVKARLRRLNTEHYLAKWGLSISMLKEKLTLLEFYRGSIDNDYVEEIAEAISEFQRYHMMRQIDGYFGELTYEKMVAALLMSGLARYPSAV